MSNYSFIECGNNTRILGCHSILKHIPSEYSLHKLFNNFPLDINICQIILHLSMI